MTYNIEPRLTLGGDATSYPPATPCLIPGIALLHPLPGLMRSPMHMRSWLLIASLVVVNFGGFSLFADPAAGQDAPLIEPFLVEGRLADGIAASREHLATKPDDDQARFGLAVAEFLQSVERLGQTLHRHGALGQQGRLTRIIPFFRLPVPDNPDPAETSYEDARSLIQTFLNDLEVAEATLAKLGEREVSMPLRFGLIRLDLDGDGETSEAEALWRILEAFDSQRTFPPGTRQAASRDELRAASEAFVIHFDRGDAYWLQGYCHLLSAVGEYALAHDTENFFAVLAPYLFAKPTTPSLPTELFKDVAPVPGMPLEMGSVADAITALHRIRFPVVAASRTEKSLSHLEQVLALSRKTWQSIQAETDNNHEWIPNASQQCVIPGMAVTAEMIAAWQGFLDESESILKGETLVPHWRLRSGMGINLRMVFLEPNTFDLIEWAQGSAAVPYVQQGRCTSSRRWGELQQAFRGQFIGFAIWFN